MKKEEIALEIVLAMIEKGTFVNPETISNEAFGKAFAQLYNAVYKDIKTSE